MEGGFIFQNHASVQFNNKMNDLISSLDAAVPMNYN